jgi:hypothetical protein
MEEISDIFYSTGGVFFSKYELNRGLMLDRGLPLNDRINNSKEPIV